MLLLFFKFTAKMKRDRVRAHSAEAAFFTIMSFFPVVMLLLALIQFTPLEPEQVTVALENITPFEVTPMLTSLINGVFDSSSALVPWTALAALWAGGKGMIGLSDGLNSVYQVEETPGYFVTRIRAAFHTIIMILALTLSMGILVLGYWIMDLMEALIPVLNHFSHALRLLPVGIAVVLLVLLFMVLYTFLPSRRQKIWKQLPGAVFTSVSWAVFSYAFSIYLEYAVNMSVIYGSLTTLVVVMLWLYFCMYLLFIGAEINNYIAHPEMF